QMFTEDHIINGAPVCIIGNSIKAKFFPTEDAIGKSIKVGSHWLKIIGVLQERSLSSASISKLGIRDYNMDVYAPIKSIFIRYRNRDRISPEQLRLEAMRSSGNVVVVNDESETESQERKNYHQLDRLVIQVEETALLVPTAEIISRLLKRRHYNVVDYEIEIPEM